MSNIERTMNILAIVNHWSMDKVESMPIDDLTREFKKLEFLNELPHKIKLELAMKIHQSMYESVKFF